MARKLYNILVLIDFTAKNKWAIAKAVELSNSFNCTVHLVHVLKRKDTVLNNSNRVEAALKKLESLKDLYGQQLCGDAVIEISILTGNRSKELVKYVLQYEMDLIITGLSKFNFLQRIISAVSISRLARKTMIPVLAIRSSGLICHYKKIVLPISTEIPIRQIRLAALLGRAFKSTVYFVSLRQQSNEIHKNIIAEALELVQSISIIPVQTFLLEGHNLAKSTLEFSKKINADLIMVNPVKDFRLPGIWNRMTDKLLSYGSKIPVVTISSNEY
jgi:nucleotide-binding universal stress UspA family protein